MQACCASPGLLSRAVTRHMCRYGRYGSKGSKHLRQTDRGNFSFTCVINRRSKIPLSSRRGRQVRVCRAHGKHSEEEHVEHGHSCCSSSLDYSHDDCIVESSFSDRVRHFLRSIGLQQLGRYLEQSTLSSIAKIVFFTAAAIFQWQYTNSINENTPQVIGDNARSLLYHKAASLCTVVVYILAGIPAALSLLLDAVALHVDTHVLMNLAVIGTLVAGLPLEGALLLVLFQTSHAVEHMLTEKAQGSLRTLFDSVPDHADVITMNSNGDPDMTTLVHVEAKDVEIDQIVLVKPGCQVPLDGEIVHGQALVSAEHITGESVPVLKRPGDNIPAGSLCHDGALCVKVTQVSEDSTPAKIARLARNAQAKRPKLRTFLDVFGEIYSKWVISATIVSFIVMIASGIPVVGQGATKGALYRAMGLLTVASPCALVMVPMAYVSAIAALASRGILLKGGRVLDAARLCRTIAMDKTGTLTTGSLEVKTILPIMLDGIESDAFPYNDALKIAKSLSIRSSHPVSTAIILHAARTLEDKGDFAVADFNLVPGGGVGGKVTLDSGEVLDALFGSLEYVSSVCDNNTIEKIKEIVSTRGNMNAIISILLLTDASSSLKSATLFLCEDTIRDASFVAIKSLLEGSWGRSRKGDASDACNIVMVTGDNEASARKIADKLGIQNVHSGLTPEEKLSLIKSLGEYSKIQNNSKKSSVMMVGDGLNDAAALAAARVGVAIASPAKAASLASDVVVMNEASGVSSVPIILRVARDTHRIILQNVFLAAASIAVLALPTVLGFIPLWLAVMFHEGSTLLVALNSLRILRVS